MRLPRADTRGGAPSRRELLSAAALLPLLAPPLQPRAAAAFSPLDALGLGGGNPQVDRTLPPVCQARTRLQDFVAVRYTGRFADGRVFDDRYATQPLVYELGSFYLPGVDEVLEGACVGSKYKLRWSSSPPPRAAEDARLLPPGSAISMDVELLTIRYSLFGEKMRNASNTYWFTPQQLTLSSPVDYERGHPNIEREPTITTDNPFSINPTERSLITNPTGAVAPLFGGLGGS